MIIDRTITGLFSIVGNLRKYSLNCWRFLFVAGLVVVVSACTLTSFNRENYFSTINQETATITVSADPVLSNETIAYTEQAIEKLQNIVDRGGWRKVPVNMTLRLGVRDASVIALRERLIQSGDLIPNQSQSDEYDINLAIAVARFQGRHGLKRSGMVDGASFYILNLPASKRLALLRASLKRIKFLVNKTSNRYIFVNVAANILEAVENDQIMSRHKTVSGAVSRKSPRVITGATQVNFNPYWHVPRSVVKDVVSYMRANPNYLSKYNIRVYNSKGAEVSPLSINWFSSEPMRYSYRQDMGRKNSLGLMRINTPNKFSVFLHDTPDKNVFSRNYRYYSAGCIRVQNIAKLAAWLLEGNDNWPYQDIVSKMNGIDRVNVKVIKQTRVIIDYIPAWATDNGAIVYNNDVYGFYGGNGGRRAMKASLNSDRLTP